MTWIDAHHHLLPTRYVASLDRLGIKTIGGAEVPEWNLQKSLAMMDRNGIRVALLSASSPGAYAPEEATAIELANICNDELMDIVLRKPDRFGIFAALPLPHVEATLQTIKKLPMAVDGFGMIASYEEKYLGHADFTPVFEELNKRKAIIFIHPTIGPGSLSFEIDLLPAVVEFTFDTTRTVLSLLRSGVFHKFPDIRFILSHNGGTIPFLAGRIASLIERRYPYQEFAPNGVTHYFKRLFYDCTTSTSEATLRCLRAFVPTTQILFGSDYPFAPEPVGARGISDIASFDGFSEADRKRIAYDNIAGLMPRLRPL